MVPLRMSESLATSGLPNPLPDRVHYGCGWNVFSGWLNVDGIDVSFPHGDCPSDLARKIFRCDLAQPHPFPDDVFDFAYSEDFIEHLDQASAIVFLCEAFRCLRPGGWLRLSCPELDRVVKKHLSGHPRWPSDYRDFRTEAYDRWNHLHFWTVRSLFSVARSIGYWQFYECTFGHSECGHFALIDSRRDQAALNLYVEVQKPR